MKTKLPKAAFSPDRRYRYILTRVWDNSKPMCAFIGLNPSTADENTDDPTIRRCIGYAKAWGYGGLIMGNLFAYRATDPRDMKRQLYPHGSENNSWLQEIVDNSELIVAAWGVHGTHKNRDEIIKAILMGISEAGLIKFCHLGLTKGGHPKHPLYLKKDLKPIPWEPAQTAPHAQDKKGR